MCKCAGFDMRGGPERGRRHKGKERAAKKRKKNDQSSKETHDGEGGGILPMSRTGKGA